MKKLIGVTLAVVLILAMSPGIVLAKGPTDKATGYIEYYQPGYFFDFNAHASKDGRPVKGDAWNYTPSGGWYHAEVRCVNILDNQTVLFAAELVETNMPSWGPWVLIKVYDGGTPGRNGDLIWGQFLSEDLAKKMCQAGDEPSGGPWSVLSGNLQVHVK